MSYQNPIPTLGKDEHVSKEFYVSFAFDEYATIDEALDGINQLLQSHDGKIPENWLKFGDKPRVRLYAENGRVV